MYGSMDAAAAFLDPPYNVPARNIGGRGQHKHENFAFAAGEMSMMQRGYNAAMMLMQQTHDFTALLAFNDGSAIGAIRAFQDSGLTVPGDVSVVGLDDIPLAGFISPRFIDTSAGANSRYKMFEMYWVKKQ